MAITIPAPPDEIWPWLAQTGEPLHTGCYSHTWIERLAGIDVANADRVFPQFQTLHAGEPLDECDNMVVLAVDPCNHLVLGQAESIDVMRCTWAFSLYPTAPRSAASGDARPVESLTPLNAPRCLPARVVVGIAVAAGGIGEALPSFATDRGGAGGPVTVEGSAPYGNTRRF